jgi:hypothetical protein
MTVITSATGFGCPTSDGAPAPVDFIPCKTC